MSAKFNRSVHRAKGSEPVEIIPGQEPYLAPGVRGYTVEHEGDLYIPLIIADRPGSGDVGRYLDSLPGDRTVKVPNVLNQRLEKMLLRRGFQHSVEFDPEWGVVPVMVRKAKGREDK